MTEATADDGEIFQVKHRITGVVLFEARLSAEIAAESFGIKIGRAIELALKAGAYLAGADLAGADLAGADLAGANLARADLAGADLARAYLARADLAGANLARAYLARADLADADLAGADLADAYLAGADLAGAYLAGAYLAGADLAGANLARADLAGAKGIIAAGHPNGFLAVGYRANDAIRVRVGCRDKSLAAAREYWSPAHPDWAKRQEIPAALDFIEAVAGLRGWSA